MSSLLYPSFLINHRHYHIFRVTAAIYTPVPLNTLLLPCLSLFFHRLLLSIFLYPLLSISSFLLVLYKLYSTKMSRSLVSREGGYNQGYNPPPPTHTVSRENFLNDVPICCMCPNHKGYNSVDKSIYRNTVKICCCRKTSWLKGLQAS